MYVKITAKSNPERLTRYNSMIFPLGSITNSNININGLSITRNDGQAIISQEKALEIIQEAIQHTETQIIIKMDDVDISIFVDMEY